VANHVNGGLGETARSQTETRNQNAKKQAAFYIHFMDPFPLCGSVSENLKEPAAKIRKKIF
jgi:hypothetical protein